MSNRPTGVVCVADVGTNRKLALPEMLLMPNSVGRGFALEVQFMTVLPFNFFFKPYFEVLAHLPHLGYIQRR